MIDFKDQRTWGWILVIIIISISFLALCIGSFNCKKPSQGTATPVITEQEKQENLDKDKDKMDTEIYQSNGIDP